MIRRYVVISAQDTFRSCQLPEARSARIVARHCQCCCYVSRRCTIERVTARVCCSPSAGRRVRRAPTLPTRAADPPPTLLSVSGGRFRMGDESVWAYPGDGEGPVHDVELGPFGVDRYAVSNARFGEFAASTG